MISDNEVFRKSTTPVENYRKYPLKLKIKENSKKNIEIELDYG